jgi:inner membrane protein
MDNLTHTIVGLAVGAALHASAAPEPLAADQRSRHRLALTACALASNFPDLDLFLTRLLPAPLGYLLEHRGHTHTFLLELPQALLLCALIWLLWPAARRLLGTSARARAVLAGAVVLGFVLHISMDYLNSYGVHPFYPFDNRWLYGDMVFIVEPVFWVGAGAPLLLTIRRPWVRWAWGLALAAVLCACVPLGFLHWASLLLLAAMGGAVLVVQRLRPYGRASFAAGLGLCAAFIGAQAAASHWLRAAMAPALVDVALTPFPANPLCWNYVRMDHSFHAGPAGQTTLRAGIISLAPGIMPVRSCPPGLMPPLPAGASPAEAVFETDSLDTAALAVRAADDCYLRAWLRFARMPLLVGERAADLRYGNTPKGNFSSIDLAAFKGRACPAYVPPWDMPRADVLQGAR